MPQPSKPRILVIGGYGVFGSRLCRRLARHPDIDVLVAGRSLEKARAHCRVYGGTPLQIDLTAAIEPVLRDLRPTVVVDAAGPFQQYGKPTDLHGATSEYRVAVAAIAVGAHYLDLADDPQFVSGISELDEMARAAGVTILSGCSSVPAISAAAVTSLSEGLAAISSIDSCILPGNRAPRGESVVRAILDQVGRPISVVQDGLRGSAYGWCKVYSRSPVIAGKKPIGHRWASPIGAPDLTLFPQHFTSPTVRFTAGLELSVMHLGLAVIARAVRAGLLRSAVPLTRSLLFIANLLKPFGSDRGAMTVDVIGRDDRGRNIHRRWTLIAEAGDGPEIPPTPAYLLALRLSQEPASLTTGARPALDDLTLAEIEHGLAPFEITFGRSESPAATLFEAALGQAFAELPAPLRDLHMVHDIRIFAGISSVERGKGIFSRLMGWTLGFPPAGKEIPVRVDMERTGAGERWQRTFGRYRFRSRLSRRDNSGNGEIWEKFGPLMFRIALTERSGCLHYPVNAGRIAGFLPVPQFLLPKSDTHEYVDDQGRACFDVQVSHPFAGFIVRYHGWLVPARTMPRHDLVEPTTKSPEI